jgi:hypothetical protein
VEQILARLAALYPITVTARGAGWDVTLPPRGDFAGQLRIGPAASDWDARVLDPADGRELWNEWMDYRGYDDRPEVELIEEKQQDIASFIESWISATDLRVTRSLKAIFWGLLRTSRVEVAWEHSGTWQPIRIWEKVPPNKRMQLPDASGRRNVR